MKYKLSANKPLLWMLAIPVLNLFYGVLNHGNNGAGSLATDLDAMIPFIPAFAVPYLLWYPFVFGMMFVFFFKNRQNYYRTLLTLCAGLLVSYATYAVYQTTVPRAAITENGFFEGLVRFIYSTDQPYNCFPSIHVLTSYLMIKGVTASRNFGLLTRASVGFFSWAIIASTLLIKQHVIMDAVGAIVLVELLFPLFGLFTGAYAARKLRSDNAVQDKSPLPSSSRKLSA
ncbi:phosphatase PAP2 family protein [Paenibacillus sp. MBLB4367]|uniref:phosphatase PAP2 family protein n=1 Tax=Paenibacillus sp. MBLB4367 TaxID=3384767 RepID=UPI00390826C7